ncbi:MULTISPECIES: hypothetical protein [unclassified Microbacterium]|uniref:hypothetical protein n=1 Tax=unclassified Microbacterium TaxID=2609290 RepID=UPI001604E93D|nr:MULTISPECIES: hypothetical protein [unclassified Microbacterium]QNA91509.1 hypothetical protein G4G29_01930 [Microbacterium sp. Se63.02b]QYM64684.1 hypothetical protein K1X59_01945 [Microbacterium sp. Se5.02b]
MTESDPHLLGPGLLPTPFTAAEIRDATGQGKTIHLLLEGPDGPLGEHVNRFHDVDDEGATLDRWAVADPKAVVSSRVTWAELQGHAAFDAGTTSVSTVTLPSPLGELTCRRYDTEDGVFWFSVSHPGMPVQYESDGMRTTVLSIEPD